VRLVISDAAAVADQLEQIASKLGRQFPAVETILRDAAVDVCTFAAFPQVHWRKIWSTNPLERSYKAIKRRTNVVGIFPQRGRCDPARRLGADRGARRVAGQRPALALGGSMAKPYAIDNDDGDTREVGLKRNELLAGCSSSDTDVDDHADALISHHSAGHGRISRTGHERIDCPCRFPVRQGRILGA
jgi:hypothetical protein